MYDVRCNVWVVYVDAHVSIWNEHVKDVPSKCRITP